MSFELVLIGISVHILIWEMGNVVQHAGGFIAAAFAIALRAMALPILRRLLDCSCIARTDECLDHPEPGNPARLSGVVRHANWLVLRRSCHGNADLCCHHPAQGYRSASDEGSHDEG